MLEEKGRGMDRGGDLMILQGENKPLGFDVIFKQLQMPAWEPEGDIT